MSRHAETFLVVSSLDRTQALCDQATASVKSVSPWAPSGSGSMRKVVKQGWGLFTNPATIEIELSQAAGGIAVSLYASSIGFGPIQDANLRKAVLEFRTFVERGSGAPVSVPGARSMGEPRRAEEPAPPASAHRLFVSYRREDSADVTGRICDALEREFGAEAIFRDVDSIPLGVDFRQHLGSAIQRCHVLLAVIGKDWIGTGEPGGPRRIDDPTDFVRVEIESAIQRDIPVIPLLVNRAAMPRPEQLPSEIAALAYRNGMPIRHDPDFRTDVTRLCHELRQDLERRAGGERKT